MADPTKEEVVKTSPVGTPPTAKQKPTNKDGFIKGQEVNQDEYFKFISQQRAKK